MTKPHIILPCSQKLLGVDASGSLTVKSILSRTQFIDLRLGCKLVKIQDVPRGGFALTSLAAGGFEPPIFRQ